MTGSIGRGVFPQLQHLIARQVTAAAVAFIVTIAIAVALMVLWPGGAPFIMAIVGFLAAIAAAIGAATLLDRRHPYFRSREEVEEVLRLPVLAVCSPRRER